ncbi:hypothetical protein Tco_0407372 [Tanacetum coccineum]
MNENYYEPNFCYDSNSFGFDQVQPPQYPVIHHPPQETTVEMLQARENLMESIETFLKKFNRISFRETPKVLMQAWDTFFEIKHACKEKQHQPEVIQELLNKLLNDVQIISEEQADYINSPSWNRPAICYDDDDDEESSIPLKDIIISGLPPCVAITPVLLTEEPVDSLIMEDEHLDTIPATKSDEVIKSSVEDLVPIPSESEDIPDKMCDVPFHDNSPPLDISKDQFEGFSDSNDDSTSIDDDSFSIDDIDYVEASPPDSELVSLEVVEIVISEVGWIDIDILQTIKDDILREKLLNVNLLIAKIEALKDNPTLSSDFMTNSGSTTTHSDYSLPDYEAFYDHIEEKSSGSTTTHANISQYDSFIFDLSIHPFPPAERSDFYHEEFADELAHIISSQEYNFHVLHDLPTHPTLYLDSDFTLSSDSPGSDLVVSFPSGNRNKIFDPGIFINVQFEKFLSRDEFSISFIRDPVSPVIDTLLLFLFKNEDKVVNSGILAADEEKSPHSSSHRSLRAFNESPMMISGEDIPILDVLFLHFYPP